MQESRWQNCVVHYNNEVLEFFSEYFTSNNRKCLLIGGAGFDPRSTLLIKHLSSLLDDRLESFLIKEERPAPSEELAQKAGQNIEEMKKYCASTIVKKIDIFAADNAVVGGRNVIRSIREISLKKYTDVVLDMSALSMGISFPVARYLYEHVQNFNTIVNVHLVVISNPNLDSLIDSTPNDRVSNVHGFAQSNLYGQDEQEALLWLPQLSVSKIQVLKMIHRNVKPHDTCPILPFPTEQPKKGDEVVLKLFSSIREAWGRPLENEWGLDPRNFLYADERKPLDIYRSILRLDDERRPVFESFGGSRIILSPVGSKIPAIGALMAAIERKFPVVYVESLAYSMSEGQREIGYRESRLAHIWLFGDAYLRDTLGKAAK